MRDTIAAISTAVSASGIGIIRVSGNRAVEIADQVYRSKKKNWNLSDAETHTRSEERRVGKECRL